MDPTFLRAYRDRDWAGIADLDRAHWAAEYRERGPAVTIRISLALWAHMRALRPDWPTAAEQARDLEHHIELKGKLDRAAGDLSNR